MCIHSYFTDPQAFCSSCFEQREDQAFPLNNYKEEAGHQSGFDYIQTFKDPTFEQSNDLTQNLSLLHIQKNQDCSLQLLHSQIFDEIEFYQLTQQMISIDQSSLDHPSNANDLSQQIKNKKKNPQSLMINNQISNYQQDVQLANQFSGTSLKFKKSKGRPFKFPVSNPFSKEENIQQKRSILRYLKKIFNKKNSSLSKQVRNYLQNDDLYAIVAQNFKEAIVPKEQKQDKLYEGRKPRNFKDPRIEIKSKDLNIIGCVCYRYSRGMLEAFFGNPIYRAIFLIAVPQLMEKFKGSRLKKKIIEEWQLDISAQIY